MAHLILIISIHLSRTRLDGTTYYSRNQEILDDIRLVFSNCLQVKLIENWFGKNYLFPSLFRLFAAKIVNIGLRKITLGFGQL